MSRRIVVVIKNIEKALAEKGTYEEKFERVLAAAMPLAKVELKVTALAEVILLHLAKRLQFPTVPYSWEKEIADNMCNSISAYSLKTNNKAPSTTQLQRWFNDAGNDIHEMKRFLNSAQKDVYREGFLQPCEDIDPLYLLEFWKKFSILFSKKSHLRKVWLTEEIKELIEQSK
jgi:hypothetical protein